MAERDLGARFLPFEGNNAPEATPSESEWREGEKGREREKRREEVMHAGATHKKCPHGNSRMSVIQVYLYIYLSIHMHNLPLRI